MNSRMKKQKNMKGKPRRTFVAATALKMKLKKGDNVIILAGKDKGKTGAIAHVFPKTNRVVIDGVAVKKRHTRASAGQTSRIIEVASSIHASNVAIAVDGKPSRIGRRMEGEKNVRFAKKGGGALK